MFEVELALKKISDMYSAYLTNYDSLNKAMAPNDFMAGDNYFDVGKSSIGAIVTALLSAGLVEPKRILDLACGNGRTTRHLALLFPKAEITVCDLYPEMVEFCVKNFGAKGVVSKENLADLEFGDTFDLIWCGSLLTHCDAPLFGDGLNTIRKALATPGVAVVTLHGRRAISLQRYAWKICSDELFRPAERQFYKAGFGFINTFDDRAKDLFPLNVNLGGGFSFSSMSYVCNMLAEMDDIMLLFYREMGWNGHQDVVAFGRPGVYPAVTG